MRIATTMIMVTMPDHSADHFCVELQLQRGRYATHGSSNVPQRRTPRASSLQRYHFLFTLEIIVFPLQLMSREIREPVTNIERKHTNLSPRLRNVSRRVTMCVYRLFCFGKKSLGGKNPAISICYGRRNVCVVIVN